ncbi:MAG: RagB/SusD family nutrient uptake outer membrane protein [Chitinophaga sp.]
MNRNKQTFRYQPYGIMLLLLVCTCLATGCGKLIEISDPRTTIQEDEVFANNELANSVMAGIYSYMMSNTGTMIFSNGGMSVYAGMSADELVNFGGVLSPDDYQFRTNTLIKENLVPDNYFWAPMYKTIFSANAVIGGVAASTSTKLEPATRAVLTGEAKFVRAFCYFYLVNLYGDVPLALSTDFNVNMKLARTPKEEVYKQIVADLKDAQTLLTDDYSISGGERIRPNKGAATALLARVYLYMQDWPNADAAASAVIGDSQYKLPDDLTSVFLKNSTGAIWQLQQNPAAKPYNGTWDGANLSALFAWTDLPPELRLVYRDSAQFSSLGPYLIPRYYFTKHQAAAFEADDKRKSDWASYTETPVKSEWNGDTVFYARKYTVAIGSATQPVTQYYMVLRLAEQYLIRAEARARIGADLTGAAADLDALRLRAGLKNTTAVTPEALLEAVAHERQVELFAEWGHRWFDLKRTGKAKEVLGAMPEKQPWNDNQLLYPISPQEILKDPRLKQNPGYF